MSLAHFLFVYRYYSPSNSFLTFNGRRIDMARDTFNFFELLNTLRYVALGSGCWFLEIRGPLAPCLCSSELALHQEMNAFGLEESSVGSFLEMLSRIQDTVSAMTPSPSCYEQCSNTGV